MQCSVTELVMCALNNKRIQVELTRIHVIYHHTLYNEVVNCSVTHTLMLNTHSALKK